jgi:hypothetical protein
MGSGGENAAVVPDAGCEIMDVGCWDLGYLGSWN